MTMVMRLDSSLTVVIIDISPDQLLREGLTPLTTIVGIAGTDKSLIPMTP